MKWRSSRYHRLTHLTSKFHFRMSIEKTKSASLWNKLPIREALWTTIITLVAQGIMPIPRATITLPSKYRATNIKTTNKLESKVNPKTLTHLTSSRRTQKISTKTAKNPKRSNSKQHQPSTSKLFNQRPATSVYRACFSQQAQFSGEYIYIYIYIFVLNKKKKIFDISRHKPMPCHPSDTICV